MSLRQVLQLILKLFQALVSGQAITLKHIQSLNSAMASLTFYERQDLAELTANRLGVVNAEHYSYALTALAARKINLRTVSIFADALLLCAEQKQSYNVKRDRTKGHILALRLVLRNPNHFGGRQGTPKELGCLLDTIPQHTAYDNQLAWVLSGGWAVELLCGTQRKHHDIDAVLLTYEPIYLDTDTVHTDDYFGIISCTRRFFRSRCTTSVLWNNARARRAMQSCREVVVARPEFLFCSKALRKPRPKDWKDIEALVKKFADTWDIKLLRDCIKRNTVSFKHPQKLLNTLRTRNVKQIISWLRAYWDSKPN